MAPSPSDFVRLRRALLGFLLLIVAQLVSGFAVQFDGSNLIVDGLFCLLYCSVPVVGIVAVWRSPFPPPDDPQHERYLKAAVNGRRACFWLGIGCVAAGVSLFALMAQPAVAFFCWFVAFGLLLVGWSFQFPRVVLSADQQAKRRQFSLKAILIITAIAAVYMGAVALCTEPGDSLVWRLLKPLVAIGALSFFFSLFIAFVVTPIRVLWAVAVKVFSRRAAKTGSVRSGAPK